MKKGCVWYRHHTRNQRQRKGFALPTVLIVSIVMLTVLVAAVTSTAATRVSLQSQNYDQMARTAAASGVAYAKACLAANSGVPQWSNANPLTPATDCSGNVMFASSSVKVLVVAGGGGGGTNGGGGGGAGGLLYKAPYIVSPGQSIPVTVGSGGAGSTVNTVAGSNGGNSVFGSMTAIGGGGGSSRDGGGAAHNGGSGGGGGGGSGVPMYQPGIGTTGQGRNGGSGTWPDPGCPAAGGGGGGALDAGTASSSNLAGVGGNGLSNSITGAAVTYAGGGGGGTTCAGTFGAGGAGGGGTSGTPAVANRGGGGAGAGPGFTGNGNGGSGVVIVSYPTGSMTATGGTITSSGGNTIHTFNGSGTFTVTSAPFSCPSDIRCSVTVNGNLRSSFSVGSPVVNSDGVAVSIPSIGTMNVLRTSNNSVWRTYNANMSGILPSWDGMGLASGANQVCDTAASQAYCWGDNGFGALGNNSNTNSLVPVAVYTNGVLAGKTVTSTAVSHLHTCAVASGQAYCWGNNGSGELGNNSTTSSLVPVAVYTSGVLAGKTVTGIAVGSSHTCAVASGQAYCWGINLYGELGNNSTTRSLVPVAVYTSGVLAGKTVTSVSSGSDSDHTCVVASGQAYCWGSNLYGALGNNSTTDSSIPVAVDTSGALSGKTITSMSGNDLRTCVVASGQAYCWGFNGGNEFGNKNPLYSSVPIAVDPSGVLAGKTITSISSGQSHICVVASGQAYCWGYNLYGQLGNNSTTDSVVPVAVNTSGVLAGKTVTNISSGNSHTCAVASGQLYCWGSNVYGQLGNNSTTNSLVPVLVDASNLY